MDDASVQVRVRWATVAMVMIWVCLRQDHSVTDCRLPGNLPTVFLPWFPRCRDHLTVMHFWIGAFFSSPNCLLQAEETAFLSCPFSTLSSCAVSVAGYRLGADGEARIRAGVQQPLPGWLTLLLPDNKPVRKKVSPQVLPLSSKNLQEQPRLQ